MVMIEERKNDKSYNNFQFQKVNESWWFRVGMLDLKQLNFDGMKEKSWDLGPV